MLLPQDPLGVRDELARIQAARFGDRRGDRLPLETVGVSACPPGRESPREHLHRSLPIGHRRLAPDSRQVDLKRGLGPLNGVRKVPILSALLALALLLPALKRGPTT